VWILIALTLCILQPWRFTRAADTLYGFTPASSPAQREWEKKFTALPDPQIMRESMRRLSARPHHLGSPYDKDNAQWLLAQFKWV
jgi:N-acetylated-alpha-linked acidic dipeptidase